MKTAANSKKPPPHPLTVFPQRTQETDKTDKTDSVANNAFLEVVFGNLYATSRPMVVSFAGNPNDSKDAKWTANAWTAEANALPAKANNYFSLATFQPDEHGNYKRKKSLFSALHAIMLDDVGTKVPKDRLTLEPSWLIETSPDNYQAGYLLREPIEDPRTADNLMKAIIDAGLSDPGANGPTARLARLPVAINGKHSPPFMCRLEAWDPVASYSVEELVSGLQLDMTPTGRPSRRGKHKQPQPEEGDEIWFAPPSDNPVIAKLKERGLYKSQLDQSKHDITCPWVHEHTDAVDNGTAYFEPSKNWPIGGFKCHHGHCSTRSIRDFLDWLDIEPAATRARPTIRVVGGEMDRVLLRMEEALASTGSFFQRGGQIVSIHQEPERNEARIEVLSQSALVRSLASIIAVEKYDGRTAGWIRTDPPVRHCSVLHDSGAYSELHTLNGLASQPYFRAYGSLVTTPVYDPQTGIFGTFEECEFAFPSNPTRLDAEAALAELDALLDEFDFGSDADKSATLSAILTGTVRPSLPTAPMFHVRAHAPGSGKSYLCSCISAFATPRRGTPTTFPTDDDECRKHLIAELMYGPAVVEYDNLTSDLLAHKSLCTALTSEYFSGRILGVSATTTVSTRTLFLSSGNNVGPIQDMTRRTVTINLAPQCEHPSSREFKRPDLVGDIHRERSRYVSLALTIIAAWINAGRPRCECRPVSSFNEWSDLCRQPLLWLDCEDPATSIFTNLADDPDRELLGRLLHCWYAVFQDAPTMVRDAIKASSSVIESEKDLSDVLYDIAGEKGAINSRRLGRWIKRHSGRIVDSMRFVPCTSKNSSQKWQIESVMSVSSVSSSQEPKTVTTAHAYDKASNGG